MKAELRAKLDAAMESTKESAPNLHDLLLELDREIASQEKFEQHVNQCLNMDDGVYRP